jgi:cell division septation protein DedD
VNTLLDETDDREDRRRHTQGADREITLGTTMILLIFFALAVYGAVLFGFGYSLGSKHSGATPVTVAAAPTASPTSFTGFKPSAGSPVGATASTKVPASVDDFVAPIAPTTKTAPPAKTTVDATLPDESATKPKTPPPAASPNSPVAAAAAVPVAGFGSVVVQVAAVSHQEDADLIASTLKRRGYVVNIRTEADKLLHVQVGPFATRKDAEVMKAKLLADGFNAYIK